MAELKGTLEKFSKSFWTGNQNSFSFEVTSVSFEPGVEVDALWKGKWLELCGAGIVHRECHKSFRSRLDKVARFAFGMGVDRLVMLRYGVDDIRNLYNGDLRLINQF